MSAATADKLRPGSPVKVAVGWRTEPVAGQVWSAAPGGRYWISCPDIDRRPILCRRKRGQTALVRVEP